MGMQMVYAQKSCVDNQRQGFGESDAYQKTAKKSGTARDGNNVDMFGHNSVALRKLVKEWADAAAMFARGQLRDNSPEKRMNVGLAGHNGINQISVTDESQSRFIAGSFYTEAEHNIPAVKVDPEPRSDDYLFLCFA
jgi:hypothetical protein